MLVAVTFTTSPSHLFPVALEIAAQAAEFSEEPVGKIKRYRAAFAQTAQQAELAVALLQHLDNIKGVLIHAGGRLAVQQDAVVDTLGCFIAANAGGGPENYCLKTIDVRDLKAEHKKMMELDFLEPQRLSIPCAKILRSGFIPKIDGSLAAQIIAEATREGCDWCPNFSAGAC